MNSIQDLTVNAGQNPFTVAQLGARMGYVVPASFYEAGILSHFYTDICVSKGGFRILPKLPRKWLPKSLQRLADRDASKIPSDLVAHFPFFGLEYAWRLRNPKNAEAQINAYLWAEKTFSEKILCSTTPGSSSLYCFNTAGLSLLKAWHNRGGLKVLEQSSAAKRIENELVREEFKRHPGWETPPADDGLQEILAEKEEAEWALADIIVCGSEWVKSSVEKCGGPFEKCVVVPYGINVSKFRSLKTPWNGMGRKLRVLTVGNISLHKGVADVLAVAERLSGRADFRVVGTVKLLADAAKRLNKVAECTGIVARSVMHEHFQWADVFLFLSRSEGSATVTYEALAAGLPVITTVNSGSIVQDEINGYIVEVGNIDAMVQRLEGFMTNHELLQSMTLSAEIRSQHGTVEAYATRLLDAVR